MAEIEVQKAEVLRVVERDASEPAVRLAQANMQALDHVVRFFDYATTQDLDDRKLTGQANALALGIITRQIRVDDGRWRQGSLDVIGELLREIAQAREDGSRETKVVEG